MHAECCCRCCCCSVFVILLLLVYQLPQFVIVCRMAKNVAGSLNLIPSIVFVLFILKYDLVLMYVPLRSAVALTSSICLYYILGNYELARSQGGRQPAAANILLYVCIIIIRGTFLW